MQPPAASAAPLLASPSQNATAPARQRLWAAPAPLEPAQPHSYTPPPRRLAPSASSQPSSPGRIERAAAHVTQTPNRLHHEFTQFTRGRHSIADISPLPISGRRHSWQHTQRALSANTDNNTDKSITDIHEYLAILQQLRRADTDGETQPQNTNIVAGFQSLAQELSLFIQERELRTQTGGQQQLQSPRTPSHSRRTSLNRSIADDHSDDSHSDEHKTSDTFPQHLTNAARSIETDIHQCDWSELQSRLETDLKHGLSFDTVCKRQLEVGVNLITPPPSPSMVWLFVKELFSGFGPILWTAAALALIAWRVGDPPDIVNLGLMIIIVVVILLSSSFAFYQSRKSLNIVQSFGRMLPSIALVHREDQDIPVLATDLVPGDIVKVKIGDKCPADIRLLECESLTVNNSALTGESEGVNCTQEATSASMLESTNICFYSSLVIGGNGTGVVVATGDRTVLGRVSALTQGDRGQRTNLENEIHRFTIIICAMALSTAIICFIAWIVWLSQIHPNFMSLASFFSNVIGLVVAFLPDGLPLALSLVLTFVAQRMYRQKVLVKNLSVVESFNSVSMILSDKTGTLTNNQLTVVSALYGRHSKLAIPIRLDDSDSHVSGIFATMLNGAVLCNNVELLPSGANFNEANDRALAPIHALSQSHTLSGDAVDVALAELAMKYQFDLTDRRARHPRVKALPFNSKTKLMISVNQLDVEDSDSLQAWMKGAPELVLNRCSHWLNDSGEAEDMSDDIKTMIAQRQESMGALGYRVIALANQSINSKEIEGAGERHELNGLPGTGFCFVGLFAMLDPPRTGVPEAVLKAAGAGITTSMITGDHPSTALAIARQVHIVGESQPCLRLRFQTDAVGRMTVSVMKEQQVIHEHIIGQLEDSERVPVVDGVNTNSSIDGRYEDAVRTTFPARIWNKLLSETNHSIHTNASPRSFSPLSSIRVEAVTVNCAMLVTGSDLKCFDHWLWNLTLSHRNLVFARTSPEQKLKIVAECQKRGAIVTVTGDGVNDAPALRRADIGVAMQAGAEVAREAAALILLDNNFVSVVSAIETGRLVSENLKKVTVYLLPAGSFSELLPILVNFFLGIPLPLSPFLMIVICMLTDCVPSLALVNEGPEGSMMKRAPAIRSESHLVDWRLLLHAYGFVGMIESIAAFLCFFWYFDSNGLPASALFLAFDSYSDGYYGKSMDELNELVLTGQSIFFVSLVITQFANLLSSRTRVLSFFQHQPLYGPSRNLALFVSMIVSCLIAIFITQLRFFNDTFHTRPVPVKFVMPSLGFGALLFLADEARKWIKRTRPQSRIAQLSW